MKVALYLRKSRADDANAPIEETLRRHRETLLQFAQEQGLSVPEQGIYEEVASGDSLYCRPQMLRLLSEADQYNAVLCMDIDRLGRGAMSEQGIILERLKALGVKIITPRRIYDLNNELDEEYTEFETFIARRELKLIKRRMQRGIRKTVEEGGYLSNPPYGYEKAVCGKHPTLKICEPEANFVRMIFELYVNDNYGCQKIAAALNALGAKPRRSEEFCRTTVYNILKNPVYTGKTVWNRRLHLRTGTDGEIKTLVRDRPQSEWTVIKGLHPPIISDKLFQQAQEILVSHSHSPSSPGSIITNPMAGLLRCKACGRAMQRRPNKKQGTAQLLCPRKGCVKSSSLTVVNKAAETALKSVLKRYALKIIPNHVKNEYTAETLAKAQQEKKAIQRQLNRLYDLLEQEIYGADLYQQRRQALLLRLETILTTEKTLLGKKDTDLALKESTPSNLWELYQKLNFKEKNELLKTIIEHGEYWKAPDWKAGQFELTLYLWDL